MQIPEVHNKLYELDKILAEPTETKGGGTRFRALVKDAIEGAGAGRAELLREIIRLAELDRRKPAPRPDRKARLDPEDMNCFAALVECYSSDLFAQPEESFTQAVINDLKKQPLAREAVLKALRNT